MKTTEKPKKIDPKGPGTALEQLGNLDPAAAAEALGYDIDAKAPKSKKAKRHGRSNRKGGA